MSRRNKPDQSTETFYIYTVPLASQFARGLQQAIQPKVKERVLRTRFLTRAVTAKNFVVTPSDVVKDKLEQLTAFKSAGLIVPEFTTQEHGIHPLSGILLARHTLRGTQGEGIEDFEVSDPWPRAPLYVEYIPKSKEYRFHVLGKKVIDVQEKRKKRDFADDRNPRIRNVDNGYAYCRGDVHYDDLAATLAVKAVAALDYAYGAVDIIWSKKRNSYFVLEVNSKPGMEGTTLETYSNALIDHFNLTRI